MESSNFLLCDEELSFSSISPTQSTNIVINHVQLDTTNSTFVNPVDIEEQNTLTNYLKKEKDFLPSHSYLERLLAAPVFSAARSKAVDWILKASTRLNLQYETAFAAVNYFDRFFSKNFYVSEMLMGDLIAISCLSVACKLTEVYVPNLIDIQIEDTAYSSNTIRIMEVKVLEALDYKLLCVTSYSYLDILIHNIQSPHPDLNICTAEFLLRIQLEDKFVNCSAIATAIAALQCSTERLMPFEYDEKYYSTLEQLVPSEHKEEKEKCFVLMKRYLNTISCPMSPVSVFGK